MLKEIEKNVLEFMSKCSNEVGKDANESLAGYKIFHYTGKEILEQPNETAAQIISYLTDTNQEYLNLDSGIEG